ncbi:hypothetical protein GA0070607_2359 [Micromonospora coriariae]|uniref:Uncharacterized protein n=1 Tax=Micromonospora coriariae TaxID=285665 RepID=A0A1C4VMU6_9ACTN|nr:hypothetical protein [Micromonospora coriariae]SCE85131.1 hypothetical protein GA0070607_2359 [Micromonospora coriariae]
MLMAMSGPHGSDAEVVTDGSAASSAAPDPGCGRTNVLAGSATASITTMADSLRLIGTAADWTAGSATASITTMADSLRLIGTAADWTAGSATASITTMADSLRLIGTAADWTAGSATASITTMADSLRLIGTAADWTAGSATASITTMADSLRLIGTAADWTAGSATASITTMADSLRPVTSVSGFLTGARSHLQTAGNGQIAEVSGWDLTVRELGQRGLAQIWAQAALSLAMMLTQPRAKAVGIPTALYLVTAWYLSFKSQHPAVAEELKDPFWVMVSLVLGGWLAVPRLPRS